MRGSVVPVERSGCPRSARPASCLARGAAACGSRDGKRNHWHHVLTSMWTAFHYLKLDWYDKGLEGLQS